MIQVSRLNGSQFYLNAELIQVIEATPDTVITLTNNVKVIVKEPAAVVVARFIEYQRQIRSSQVLEHSTGTESGA